jgi:penicillin amidase
MRRVIKIVLILVGIIAIVPALALVLGYFLVVRPAFPQTEGELSITGLHAPVTIHRDSSGIPHILAEDAHDLFFAQGFVHAQDRLWAMESARRAAHGTLSEVIGKRGLDNDRFMRILGMTESAQADWESLDEDSQAMLQAYAAGVNAFLDRAGGKLPLEFKILGIVPEPWTPVDSLVFGKLVAWGLSNNYQDELVVAKLAGVTSWENVLSILPEYPGPDVIPDANRLADLSATATALLVENRKWQDATPFSRPDQGSNAWVIGESRTASGAPLLANDPHQGLSMPSLWYEAGLHTADGAYDVVGGSLPGLPGIEIGHNARIAWGVTNARPDVQDLFVETLDDTGNRYQFQGEWRDLILRQEIIRVKGGEPVTLTVRSTHHGPLVSDASEESEQVLALRWTGLDQGRPLARAILSLNRAQSWEEFRDALRYWQLPGMNFVYADVEGNIGYQMSGAVPIRAQNDVFGLLPVSGADGEHEWTGFVPFDELPSALNPSADFFASANNRPAGPDYPHFLSHYFQPPYRVVLISEQLRQGQNVTVDDFATLQANWRSEINRQVAQSLATEATPQSAAGLAAQGMLADWDGVMSPESGAAAVSEAALWHILRQVLTSELGAEATDAYLSLAGYPYMFLQNLLDDPDATWWQGDRAGKLSAALDAAADELSAQLGDDPAQWTWGAVHGMTFAHPLGNVGPLRPIFNRGSYPTGGNWNTVNSGAYYPDKRYAMGLGPAYRIINDLANWDNSRSIVPTGQSGQPFSKHYDDQIASWLAVEYHFLPFSRSAVEEAAAQTLRLVP